MNDVYLLLGSNQGAREQNLEVARREIARLCGEVKACSHLYKTAAWGLTEQPDFLNQALQVKTMLTPVLLLKKLKSIELETGRVETIKWGPRVLDIDILLYGNQVLNLPELLIPHPRLAERRFTLEPLNEIAPHLVHPVLQQTIAGLLQQCPDNSAVDRVT